ncbi:DEAD/DEAH box helicase, partial [Escherichia coli]|uniref:DEAD/DEAH box helicase n=1 Tax=Escherichia coli TaxID=562 RepID=UPI00321A23B7
WPYPRATSSFNRAGIYPASPIQAKAIPSILAGSDLIAGANTGSGKTATFALPILQKISQGALKRDTKGNYVSALILVPTRELAT